MHDAWGMPLEQSLPGSGAEEWLPTSTPTPRQARAMGPTADLERPPSSLQLLSPSSETAVASDPILGGELVIRVIDAQVSNAASCPRNSLIALPALYFSTFSFDTLQSGVWSQKLVIRIVAQQHR